MKSMFITGGARGIGEAAVRLFAANGYCVAFTYNRSEDAARRVANETGALAIRADVRDRKADFDAINEATRRFGHIDAFIHNAGISQFSLFTDITPESWDDMLAVHLSGAFHCAQAVLPQMISRKSGSILLVSSMWGQTGGSCEVHYSAAKAGLIGMTKALAKEVGPSGVRVNCVAPGVIDTEMNATLSKDARAELCDETPLCRIGSANDVAETLLFLASDKAGFITGQVIAPNGGIVI